MKPKELVIKWVEAFNISDIDMLADLYHETAVNYQVANEPVEGKEAIKRMFMNEFARVEMTCIIENIFEEREWAILEWKDPQGMRGCGVFHIQNGKIIFQRGYWDKLSFLRSHGLPVPEN
jgi:limonene-1,2-epoxide hydrolase